MRYTTIVSTFVLAGAVAACGGPDQTATRTVDVGGNRYELVASFSPDVDQGEVDRLLARVVLVPRAGPQPIVHSLIDVDVIPHEEETPKYYAVVPPPTPDESSASEAPAEASWVPMPEKRHPIRKGNIGGATDPDVDPALPQ
jgi:hypothetical protein